VGWVPWGKEIGTGRITATLYGFNAVVPGIRLTKQSDVPFIEDGVVIGEVVSVTPTELRDFDRLEGHPHLYCRKEVPVLMDDGSEIKAWVYEAVSVTKQNTLVPSGDWAPIYTKAVTTDGHRMGGSL
jgi:gamma-glutamylcyclotransferase (GGCT)/AIG2-like uncharacterized protein YtfP